MNFLQDRISKWMSETFSADEGADAKERGFRFGEEAIELLQANGCTKEDVLKLVEYVYGRPVGDFRQEVGGTMLTLGALCNARATDMIEEARIEIMRCETPAVRAKIQAKQAMKREVMGYSPLPGSVAEPRYVTLLMALQIDIGDWIPQQSEWRVVREDGDCWIVDDPARGGKMILPKHMCSEPRNQP